MKAAVSRAVRSRECPLGELILYNVLHATRAVIGRFPWWIQHGKLVVFVLSNMARSFSRDHVGLSKASI